MQASLGQLKSRMESKMISLHKAAASYGMGGHLAGEHSAAKNYAAHERTESPAYEAKEHYGNAKLAEPKTISYGNVKKR